MTQNEFFNIIMDELRDLPELKLQKIISKYQNIISEELLLGKNEDEIIAAFGDPYLICYNYKNNNADSEIEQTDKFISSSINLKKASDNMNSFKDTANINYIQPIDNIKNHNKSNTKTEYSTSSPYVNKLLKICIIILSLIIFFPLITSIIGVIIGILGIAISLLTGSIGILIGATFTNIINIPNIPNYIGDFPYAAIILFTLGSICLSLFLLFVFYYSCKLIFRLLKRLFTFLKSKGGDFL